jgi:Putative zinc-finger
MSEEKPLCRRIRENLSAYQDGELKPGARRVIEEHMRECAECRAHYQELKDTWRLLDELEEPIIHRELSDAVWAQIEEDRKAGWIGRLERATGASGLMSGLAASIAAAVFLFGVYVSSKPIADLPTPAERECILYLDMLRDIETLEQMEMVTYVRQQGQTLDAPGEGDATEDSGV